MINLDECLKVGAIVTSHGVHGEAKVFPTTDDVNRFKKLKEVILFDGKETSILHIISVKFYKKFVILKFDEYTTPEEIMRIKGKDLFVTRDNAVKLKKDEYFIADLIGIDVILEDDSKLGVISDVIVTGANDVYDVVNGDKHILIPAIKECILNVDVVNHTMRVHLLDGLLD